MALSDIELAVYGGLLQNHIAFDCFSEFKNDPTKEIEAFKAELQEFLKSEIKSEQRQARFFLYRNKPVVVVIEKDNIILLGESSVVGNKDKGTGIIPGVIRELQITKQVAVVACDKDLAEYLATQFLVNNKFGSTESNRQYPANFASQTKSKSDFFKAIIDKLKVINIDVEENFETAQLFFAEMIKRRIAQGELTDDGLYENLKAALGDKEKTADNIKVAFDSALKPAEKPAKRTPNPRKLDAKRPPALSLGNGANPRSPLIPSVTKPRNITTAQQCFNELAALSIEFDVPDDLYKSGLINQLDEKVKLKFAAGKIKVNFAEDFKPDELKLIATAKAAVISALQCGVRQPFVISGADANLKKTTVLLCKAYDLTISTDSDADVKALLPQFHDTSDIKVKAGELNYKTVSEDTILQNQKQFVTAALAKPQLDDVKQKLQDLEQKFAAPELERSFARSPSRFG